MADSVAATGRNENDVLRGFTNYGLAALTARRARGCGQGVARDPLPEEPAHGLIVGNKSRTAKRCLANASDWIIPPLG